MAHQQREEQEAAASTLASALARQAAIGGESESETPPALFSTPLAREFNQVLEHSSRSIDAVDVCNLGCVCKELAAKARELFALPVERRRALLFVPDDERGDTRVPNLYDEAAWNALIPKWCTWYAYKPFGGQFGKIIAVEGEQGHCARCGRDQHVWTFLFDRDCGGLCRSCWPRVDLIAAGAVRTPPRFRILPVRRLYAIFGAPLPARLLARCVREVCRHWDDQGDSPGPAWIKRPLSGEMIEPRASLRRAAAYVYATHTTPAEVRARLEARERGGGAGGSGVGA